MAEEANYAGLVELVLTGVLALAFGVHQMLDLRREREKREAAKRQAAAVAAAAEPPKE
ncbi:MAG: hypothetical protein O9320_17020 [Magnetospirillum sp.]|jgi:hypothetical protein|nr:hypothetical protein [Magnetospirillum sp.]